MEKTSDSFYIHQRTKDGRRSKCIPCYLSAHKTTPEQNRAYRAKNLERIRAYDRARIKPEWKKKIKSAYDLVWRKQTAKEIKNNALKRNFGIDLQYYDDLLKQQHGCCAICLKPSACKSISGGIKSLGVDHCHKTGIVRGLLCDHCNRGIGLLRDDPNILNSAISYLQKTGVN